MLPGTQGKGVVGEPRDPRYCPASPLRTEEQRRLLAVALLSSWCPRGKLTEAPFAVQLPAVDTADF